MGRHWLVLALAPMLAGLLAFSVHHALAWQPGTLRQTQRAHVGEGLFESEAGRAVSPASDWGGRLPGDTTLDPANNPHIVNTDLIVPAGITLTIRAGVELYFAPGSALIVYGRLLAEGTATEGILFTRRDAGTYWGAIAILYSSADNRIAHAVIEYTSRLEGEFPRSHGVTAYGSRLTLADSSVRYTEGKDGAGVVATDNSILYLLRNEIHDIGGDAVHPSGGVAVIQGNHIYNARWGGYFYEGIEISRMPPHAPALVLDNHIHDVSDDCLDVNDSWVVIERNRIHDCTDKGISLGSGGGALSGIQTSSATVINNLVYASEVGVAVKDGTVARLIHNTIADNRTGLMLYEAPDHPGLGGGRGTVVNSIIWSNGQSITLDGLSTVTVTYSDVEGGWKGEGNLNADPSFETAEDYHLKEDSPAINAARDEGIAHDLDSQPRPVGRAPDMGAYERQQLLRLFAWPGDERIFLAWRVAGSDALLNSFAISYTNGSDGGRSVTGLATSTLAYTLTGLTNYTWYTVVVEGWDADDEALMRSNPAVVMPTDHFLYLPVVMDGFP
jgi:hypothetical protein